MSGFLKLLEMFSLKITGRLSPPMTGLSGSHDSFISWSISLSMHQNDALFLKNVFYLSKNTLAL